MPLGAAVIEVKPYQFVGIWPNHYLRKLLTQTDKNQSVFWYGLNVVKEQNSRPGLEEQLEKQPGYLWARDRHVKIETSMLQLLFDRIASVDGDQKKYARLASTWQHYLNDDGTTPTDWVDQELYARSGTGT